MCGACVLIPSCAVCANVCVCVCPGCPVTTPGLVSTGRNTQHHAHLHPRFGGVGGRQGEEIRVVQRPHQWHIPLLRPLLGVVYGTRLFCRAALVCTCLSGFCAMTDLGSQRCLPVESCGAVRRMPTPHCAVHAGAGDVRCGSVAFQTASCSASLRAPACLHSAWYGATQLNDRLKKQYGQGCLEQFPGKGFMYMKPEHGARPSLPSAALAAEDWGAETDR